MDEQSNESKTIIREERESMCIHFEDNIEVSEAITMKQSSDYGIYNSDSATMDGDYSYAKYLATEGQESNQQDSQYDNISPVSVTDSEKSLSMFGEKTPDSSPESSQLSDLLWN